MRNMILILAILAMPFVGLSQEDNAFNQDDIQDQLSSVIEFEKHDVIENLNPTDLVMTYYRKVDMLSDDPTEQYEMIEAEKSQNIISIKAYIKSLQMKRKETLMS